MAKSRACAAFILFVLSARGMASDRAASPPPAQRDSGVAWSQSYEVGTKVAAMEKSPVLLFFTASWCRWCQKLEREVLVQPQVISELRKFVCVKLDVEKNHDVAMAYGVVSMPRMIVINTQGEVIGDWLGYHDAGEFLQLLTDIRPYTNTAVGTKKAPQIAQPAQGPVDANQPPQATSQNPAQLIDLLGHKEPKIRQNAISNLLKAGPGAVPAMLNALEHDYLGVRITAWKIVRTLSKTDLSFDPWAPHPQRIEEIRKLREQLKNTPPSTPENQPKPDA